MRDVGSAEESNQLMVEAIESLKAYDPEKIILFGSYARGEWDRYSDIDLVIIKRTDKRFVQRLVEAGSYLNLPISVDLFVYSPEEFQAMAEEGNPFITIHSVYELALECTKRDGVFKRVVDWGKVLDKYYIPARYPDALAPPGVPYKAFTEAEARQALSYAEDIVSMVKGRI